MNYTVPSKKLIIINILDILKKYSDVNHRLSQKDIEDILLRDYSMKVGRKAIKRNLLNLIDFGYELGYTEIKRDGKNGDSTILTDWYLERDFTDAELRFLVDSVLFSKSIPPKQSREIIEKIKAQSNNYFSAKVKHVIDLSENRPSNKELFYTIEILDEAIENHKQVQFAMQWFDINKNIVLGKRSDGSTKFLTFNPYQMITSNGRYYLIGNFDYYDDPAYIRIDHITQISMLSADAKDKRKVKGFENGINLPKTMAEQIYMLYGNTRPVIFRASKSISDQIVDWFGFGYTVLKDEGDAVQIKVNVNERAMHFWSLQYGPFVEVLSPKDLREAIKSSIRKMNDTYANRGPK